jgi:Domain of Unknown Function (DUF928)
LGVSGSVEFRLFFERIMLRQGTDKRTMKTMNKLNLCQFWSLSVVLAGFGLNVGAAIASVPQPIQEAQPQRLEISQIALPNTDRGRPSSTAGGGKRGGCMTRETKALFRTILPVSNSGEAVASTIANNLSLWLYIPENNAIRAEFSVFAQNNETDALVYSQVINNIKDESGLRKLEVPDNTLKPGVDYWWDVTLACDEFDHSADLYLFGTVNRQSLEQITLPNNDQVIDALMMALRGNQSYLSLDPTDAQELLTALEQSRDEATVRMVSDRLRTHFVALRNDYAKLSQSLAKTPQNPNIDPAEIANLKKKQGAMVLELAQLSAFYGMWADTANFLTEYRGDYPAEWRSLLQSIFPGDDPTTLEQEDMIIRLLSMS